MTGTWEYRLIQLTASSPANLHRQLEDLGCQGWELAVALEHRNTLVFKRHVGGNADALVPMNPPEPDVVTGT